MSKKILTLIILLYAVFVPSIALADYTVTTQQPLQPNYYQNYQQPNVPYYVNGQNINQDGVQYVNPYQAQNGYQYNGYPNYGYAPQSINPLPHSLLNSALPYSGTNGVKQQILRGIGRNIIYSMMR